MKVTLSTGYGYVKDAAGHVVSKFELLPGEHGFPDGALITEVASREALDAVKVYVPQDAKWAVVRLQRDDMLRKVSVMGELVLFLAESEAIKAGKMTAAERTITAARAIDVALYMRKLYQVMEQADPDNIQWPAEV
jgi:hypothetical protein